MTKKGVAIQYGDVAPEAKENFYPAASESEFDSLLQLQEYNLNFLNYANPCEKYQTILDGESIEFPSNPKGCNFGLWSTQVSDDNGNFANPIVLELESSGQYSSQGLTLTFDTFNEIYATSVNIKWLRVIDGNVAVISEKNYTPDKAFYFCQNWVENYNKLIITFYSINMPYNRLKLRVIDYGYGTFFYGDELRNVTLIQEIDPISTQISINTVDFVLDSKSDMVYSFQAKQPLSVYYNGELKATAFVKSSKRKARTLWEMKCEDYIGLMDSIPYPGGMYENHNSYELIEHIFSVAKIPCKIDENFRDVTVTGYIEYSTCREALMQVAFAVQAVVDTSNSEVVKVFRGNDETTQEVPLNRIMQGQNFKDEETVTDVSIMVHSYVPKEEIPENAINVYNALEDGVGQNIYVRFPEPLFGLYTNGGGEILEYNSNYAIVNVTSKYFRLSGYGYEHYTKTVSKKNPLVLASEIKKSVVIKDATLVSDANVNAVLDKCYNWLTKTHTTNLDIVEGKHVQYGDYIKYGNIKYGEWPYKHKYPNIISYDKVVNVGDVISAETEYLGVVTGRLIKQKYKLTGNVVIKEAVLR